MVQIEQHNLAQLFIQLSEGREQAFRAIFDLYKARFYAAAFKMTRSEYQAEEIVQEVFVILWDQRHRLSGIEKPETYLFTIVYNSIYTSFKKIAAEKKVKESLSGQPEVFEASLEMMLQNKENERLLQRAVSHLPAQQQQAFQLIKLHGLSRDEAAARMNIAPNTVKNHLQEAMKFLRLYLERSMPLLLFLFFKRG